MVSGEVNLAYRPWQTRQKFVRRTAPEFQKKYDFTLMTGVGFRGKGENYPGVSHFNSTVSMCVNKRISFKRKVGVGVDFFYNEGFKERYPDRTQVPIDRLVSQSVFACTDMLVNKFVMSVQFGVYTYQKTANVKNFYERVALRYYPIEQAFVNVSIKAHMAKADYIEWGIGVTL